MLCSHAVESRDELDGKEEEKEIDAIPMLAQNMVPGIDNVQGEDAKFKHDLSLRCVPNCFAGLPSSNFLFDL